jgi:uncharacterized phage-associated protein
MSATATQIYTPAEIADWVLVSAKAKGELITPLKLQKLVFYAQAWMLALKDRPLFAEDFQAWMHGPVLRSLYDRHRAFAYEAVPVPDEAPEIDEEAAVLLRDVMDAYVVHTATELVDLTHKEEPWITARGGLPPEARCENIIPKDHIARYYRQMYQELDGE